MSCRHVREWLHRDAASLDEAQRLQLDDHLASCESCRGDRERMLTLHRAGASLESPPSDARMYDRAIARALLEGPRAVEPVRARRMWPVAIGAAAAIAIVFALALRSDDESPNGVASKGTGDEANGVAAKGTVDVAPDHVPAPSPAPSPAPVVPHEIEISPEQSPSSVDNANELRVQIGASAMAGAATIDRDDVPVQPDRHVELSTTRHDGAAFKAEPVSDVLARARRQLAAKQYADAERTANSVLANASTTDEAEARTILADVAQASGQLELASARYQEVASKFASLSAGESALYAAARVEVRRGRDARALLETYLARYPSGRFVNDARRLLGNSPKEQR